jgi:hypothetical protein
MLPFNAPQYNIFDKVTLENAFFISRTKNFLPLFQRNSLITHPALTRKGPQTGKPCGSGGHTIDMVWKEGRMVSLDVTLGCTGKALIIVNDGRKLTVSGQPGAKSLVKV